jgi:Secretion system C-terminal sorting domain
MWNFLLCQPASDNVLAVYPTGIQEVKSNQVTIFPNPAKNYFTILSQYPLMKIEIFSDFDKLIYSEENDNVKQLRLSVSGFTQGIYFIKLSMTSGTIFRKITIIR